MSALLITVRGYAPRSMNELLRGTNYRARAAHRKREKATLGLLMRAQNGLLPRGLEGLLRARFVYHYCGSRPDIDGANARLKLVLDALEDMGVFAESDGQVETTQTWRRRVRKMPERGFTLSLDPFDPARDAQPW